MNSILHTLLRIKGGFRLIYYHCDISRRVQIMWKKLNGRARAFVLRVSVSINSSYKTYTNTTIRTHVVYYYLTVSSRHAAVLIQKKKTLYFQLNNETMMPYIVLGQHSPVVII
uniref:Uncharacterized protein n=1 Tax=Sipha flava TaxID=143950 RepID=A0A2S2PW39_9HEMI